VIRPEKTPRVSGRGTSPRSEAFSERAHRVIPGGAHTFSRGDDQFPVEAPRGFTRGKGARVWDIEGDEYVDWGMGINNVLVGHAEDVIDDAAVAALRCGQGFSRPSELEVSTAEDLIALFPGMEMAKFGKNGSDANTAAVRLARAVTGRSVVGYDATAPFLAIHDWFIGKTAMGAGIPDEIRRLTVPFEFNDIGSVERMFAEHGRALAAVVLEVCRDVRPVPGFLEALRRLCDAHGALLVFDEVVTGFRYALHGAYTLFGVVPDLLSVGKGIANGYSLSAILGKREYMERGGIRHGGERVFFLSTTNGPEQSALAAARATIAFYQRHDVIGHLARTGQQVIDGTAAAAARHGVDERVSASSDFGARPFLRFLGPEGAPSMEFRTLFIQEMARRGVFMPWVCPSFRHGALEMERTLEALDASCAVYARALDAGSVEKYLVGPAARPVFRRFN
jgi:glutamate-1-semialdehyde 2,1-aminomutase